MQSFDSLSDGDVERLVRTRSQIAEATLEWEGFPFRLIDYPMFRGIYDGSPKKMVLKTCRQVGKSMTLSTFSIAESIAIDFFKTFFIAPTREQTTTFSTSRVEKFLTFSPHIRDNYVTPGTTNRVLARHFANGSQIEFSYASDDASRCRGKTCDRIMFDEVQDMLLDIVRPVVQECLRNSKHAYQTFCGTPKTFENGIEHLWASSTQTEWAIKCPGCGKHSILLSETQCGKQGPICTSCKAYLNPRNGIWVDMNRQPPDEDGHVQQMKGFHISRLMMPQNVPAAWPIGPQRDAALVKWKEVMETLSGPDAYPISVFRNEVLGVSDSQGRRLVTREHLEAAADGPIMSPRPIEENMLGVTRLAAGIDWSGGGEASIGSDGAVSIKSRTVLTILGKMGVGRTRLLYYRIFPGTSPVEEVNEILEVLMAYDRKAQGLMYIGADAGEGNMGTDMIRHRMSNPTRIVKFRYSGTMAGYAAWNKKGNFYSLNRTQSIDSVMTAFLRKEFQFAKKPERVMDPFYRDILAVYEEITSGQAGVARKVWRHAPNKPDDCLHSLNFGRIALQIANGEQLKLTADAGDGDD
jgi:hypothetical protein